MYRNRFPRPSSQTPFKCPSSSSATRDGGSSSSSKGKMIATGDPGLDSLAEVFPQVNFLTLIEVCMDYKDDIDAAADYIIHNVLPTIIPEENNANVNEELQIEGNQQAFDDANTLLGPAPVDNNSHSDSVQFGNNCTAENKDCFIMGEHLMELPDVASTSAQSFLLEESNSDCLLTSAQNSIVKDEGTHVDNQHEVMRCSDDLIRGYSDEQLQCSSSEKNSGMSASEDDFPMHDNGSPDMAIQSSHSISIESLDNAIANENYQKITLMSNVAAISEMIQEVELNEAKTKQVVSEANQAGNDILVEAEKLKEMSMLAAEENNKVAGEVFAEQSILASEAQGLQDRLFNISEERNNYVLIIDEMHHTLQRRLSAAEVERVAAEKEIIEREALAEKLLKEHELLLDAAKEESKKLEQQAQENAKLRELLMDRGQVVDALHGDILGIFENISQLQRRVYMQVPVDEPLQASSILSNSVKSTDNAAQLQSRVDVQLPVDEQLKLASSTLSSSIKSTDNKQLPVDEPLQLASLSFSSSVKSEDIIAQVQNLVNEELPVDEPLQFASSSFFSSVKSTDTMAQPECRVDADEPLQLASSSLSSSVASAVSESIWSSAAESNSSFSGDEKVDDVSNDNFAVDESGFEKVDDGSHGNFGSDEKIDDASRENYVLDDSWDVVEDEAFNMCAH